MNIQHRLIAAFALLLATAAAQAAGGDQPPTTIDPIRVKISPAARSGAVTVANHSKEKKAFLITAVSWRQKGNGAEEYGEPDGLVFFPRRLVLEPESKAVVRVGVKALPATSETTYRLFIEEEESSDRGAEAAAEKGAMVRFRMRMGLPVFVAPPAPKDKLKVTATQTASGGIEIEVENAGTRHEEIDIAFGKASGPLQDAPQVTPKPKYLLAGTTVKYTAQLAAPTCRAGGVLAIDVKGEVAKTSTELAIDAAKCG